MQHVMSVEKKEVAITQMARILKDRQMILITRIQEITRNRP